MRLRSVHIRPVQARPAHVRTPTTARRRLACTALWLCLACGPALAAPACPPAGDARDALFALKQAATPPASPDGRMQASERLMACLADPDPALRDGVAYETLARWLRSGAYAPDDLRRLRDQLYTLLDGPAGAGFAHPFAALVLSEVARTDRIAPWMEADERAAMVGRASAYLAGIDDDRSFDATEGWRHGVAHGADWLMQLALNPALDHEDGARMLDAIAAQVVPARAHAYTAGEPTRLARPVLFLAQTQPRAPDAWTAWFVALPPRIGDPALAYADRDWLARRHDLVAFLQALYVMADRSEDANVRALLPGIAAALEAIP